MPAHTSYMHRINVYGADGTGEGRVRGSSDFLMLIQKEGGQQFQFKGLVEWCQIPFGSGSMATTKVVYKHVLDGRKGKVLILYLRVLAQKT